jgi:hypothetical protein
MFKLDDNFLIELGLGSLPPADKNKMLAHIYETLEMRVGMRLAERMSNEQLDEFESFIKQNDEGGALKWLESNFPNYKQVVAEELDKLKSEIKQVAPQIVQSAMAAQQAPNLQQPPQPVQPQQQQSPQPVQAQPQQQPTPQPQQPMQQPQYAPPQQQVANPTLNPDPAQTTQQQPPVQPYQPPQQ